MKTPICFFGVFVGMMQCVAPNSVSMFFCSHHRWGGGGWVGGSQSLVPVGQKVVVVCYVDDNKKEKKQKILSHAQERKRRCVRISGVLGGGDGRRVVVSVKLTGNLNLAGPGLREVVVLCHYA